MKKYITAGLISVVTSFVLGGCGSTDTTTNSDGTSTGTFVDAEVIGADYNTSSGIQGTTDYQGHFKYKSGDKVTFHIGKLILGEGKPKPSGLITPQDLTDNNQTLTLMLQVLQSLDEDKNTSNGIQIPVTVISSLENINKTNLDELNQTTILTLDDTLENHIDEDHDGTLDINISEAHKHFTESENKWKSKQDKEHNQEEHKNGQNQENSHDQGYDEDNKTNGSVLDINKYYTYTLSQELKNSLSYMGNEERLAYDVYKNLYDTYNDTNLSVLSNIADKSESRHIATVRSIVEKYDINATELTNIDKPLVGNDTTSIDDIRGKYDIQHIQDLYDILYAKGTTSQKDALEVGCMVEVTDINDLDGYIEQAQKESVQDIYDAFTNLRKGSYNHYWAFDNALKDMGVTDGCCSLGTIDGVNYCHPEYPQNSNKNHENDNSSQKQGNQKGHGKHNNQ